MSTSQVSPPASPLLSQVEQIKAQLTGTGAPFECITVDVNGHKHLAYRNAFPNLPALINAGRAHAAREFMVYENDRWTFERFFQAVDALAAHLQHTLGLRPGDRVAIAMRNRPEWAVAFAAVAGPAGGNHIHPDINTVLRERNDVFARQIFLVEMIATVSTNIAVTGKQFAVGQAGLEVEGIDVGDTPGADDAVDSDDGLLTGDCIVAAMEHSNLGAHLPAHLFGGVMNHRLFKRNPRLRQTLG